MKTLLLYLSFVSTLLSDARYTTQEAYMPNEGRAVYGDVYDEVRNMDAMPCFQSVNTCATAYGMERPDYISAPVYHTAPMTVANGTIRTIAQELGDGTPASVQPLYAMQYAAPPQAPPVRRTPGVPSRAPIGDMLCPLLLCATIYALHIRHRKHVS